MEPKVRFTQGQNAGIVNAVLDKLRQAYPAADEERLNDLYWEELQREFGLHDKILQISFPFLLMVGIFGYIALQEYLFGQRPVGGFMLAFAAGFSVTAAYSYLLLLALLKGPKETLPRMYDYSTMYHGISYKVQLKFFLCPALILLLVGSLGLFLG